MSPELLQVLEAREARWQRRLALAQGRGRTLVTVTLCLPVAYRTAPEFLTLAEGRFARLEGLFLAQEIPCRREEPLNGADGPALFLTVQAPAQQVKRLCVEAEERLPGGRMLDIDVMDGEGTPVDRNALGLPPRRCFVCQQPAAACVARKIHTREEIDAQVEALRRAALEGLEETAP